MNGNQVSGCLCPLGPSLTGNLRSSIPSLRYSWQAVLQSSELSWSLLPAFGLQPPARLRVRHLSAQLCLGDNFECFKAAKPRKTPVPLCCATARNPLTGVISAPLLSTERHRLGCPSFLSFGNEDICWWFLVKATGTAVLKVLVNKNNHFHSEPESLDLACR